jgi:hypothetical protein
MKALAISIIAALCSGMAVPASAMPNMPHLFAKHEVASCGGDVAHATHPYRNSSRGYSGDATACQTGLALAGINDALTIRHMGERGKAHSSSWQLRSAKAKRHKLRQRGQSPARYQSI